MSNYPPCKNPNCKSFGEPHPHCKCYGMAKGGVVEGYCASKKAHAPSCEYYAGGGDVGALPAPEHSDPQEAVSGYIAQGGLHNIIKIGDDNPYDINKYNNDIKKGHKLLDNKVKYLFNNEKDSNFITPDYSKQKKMINDWVTNGGALNDVQNEIHRLNTPEQTFAEGGEVQEPIKGMKHDEAISSAYPDQNILLQAAKGRMSNYLNGLRPQKNTPKLAFDDEPDQRPQKKSYERALSAAANPLHVLDKIKAGTIEKEHVEHFKALHPEVEQSVQKRLMQKITELQLEGKKPSFKIRQGLSLLLGVPLSAEMTPQNIQAAQATFQLKKDQPQGAAPQGKAPSHGKSSALSKSDDAYLTKNQALTTRQQKQ